MKVNIMHIECYYSRIKILFVSVGDLIENFLIAT